MSRGVRFLPLALLAAILGVMVWRLANPADSVIRPGMELRRVNGRSIENLRTTLLRKVSGDGFDLCGVTFKLVV